MRPCSDALDKLKTDRAPEVVTTALTVELASTVVDVRGAIAVHPRLRDKTSRAGVSSVEGNRLEEGEHN